MWSNYMNWRFMSMVMLVAILSCPTLVRGAQGGGKKTITLKVPKETDKTGKWLPLAAPGKAENRFIEAIAINPTELGADARMIMQLNTQVVFPINTKAQALAKCPLDPDEDNHRAHVRGTYGTPGEGGGGGGKRPEWNGTGLDFAVVLIEPGQITIPFTASVTKKEIAKQIDDVMGGIKVDESAVAKKVREQIELQVPGIAKALLDSKVKEALDKIEKRIAKAGKDFNKKVDGAIELVATKTKQRLDKLSPKAVLRSNYTYNEGQRDPGNPGWSTPPTTRIEGGDAGSAKAEVTFDLPISFALKVPLVAEVDINLTLSFIGEVELTVQLDATGESGPSPKNRPTSTVGVTPGIRLAASGKVGGGFGLKVVVSGTVAGNASFDRIKDTIVANEIK